VQNSYSKKRDGRSRLEKLSIDEKATLQSVVRIGVGWAWAGFM